MKMISRVLDFQVALVFCYRSYIKDLLLGYHRIPFFGEVRVRGTAMELIDLEVFGLGAIGCTTLKAATSTVGPIVCWDRLAALENK